MTSARSLMPTRSPSTGGFSARLSPATGVSRWTRRETRSSSAFASAAAALAASAEAQQELAGGPIRVRIGPAHRRAPARRRKGTSVSTCTRGRGSHASAHGGQVVFSPACTVHELELEAELSSTSAEHRLKDFEGAGGDLPARERAVPAAEDGLQHEPTPCGPVPPFVGRRPRWRIWSPWCVRVKPNHHADRRGRLR